MYHQVVYHPPTGLRVFIFSTFRHLINIVKNAQFWGVAWLPKLSAPAHKSSISEVPRLNQVEIPPKYPERPSQGKESCQSKASWRTTTILPTSSGDSVSLSHKGPLSQQRPRLITISELPYLGSTGNNRLLINQQSLNISSFSAISTQRESGRTEAAVPREGNTKGRPSF